MVARDRPTQPKELKTGPLPVEQMLLAIGPSLQLPLHTLGGMFIYPKLSSQQHSYVEMSAEQLAWLTPWLTHWLWVRSSPALAQRQAHPSRSAYAQPMRCVAVLYYPQPTNEDTKNFIGISESHS